MPSQESGDNNLFLLPPENDIANLVKLSVTVFSTQQEYVRCYKERWWYSLKWYTILLTPVNRWLFTTVSNVVKRTAAVLLVIGKSTFRSLSSLETKGTGQIDSFPAWPQSRALIPILWKCLNLSPVWTFFYRTRMKYDSPCFKLAFFIIAYVFNALSASKHDK